MPEKFFLDLLDDPKGYRAFPTFGRIYKSGKTKCYVQEDFFVSWCNFYMKLVGSEIKSLVDLWDWTNFLALLDGLGREKLLLVSSFRGDVCKPEASHNWDIVQDYLIKEKAIKSIISKGMMLFQEAWHCYKLFTEGFLIHLFRIRREVHRVFWLVLYNVILYFVIGCISSPLKFELIAISSFQGAIVLVSSFIYPCKKRRFHE